MRQIAASCRRDWLSQQIASCDMRKSFSLRQNFVAAIRCTHVQTDLNSCDISKRQKKRNQPTCRGDVVSHSVFRGKDQLAKNASKKGKEQHSIPMKKSLSNKQQSFISLINL